MTKRIAAIYDIHGNVAALKAVLDDVKKSDVDTIVIGGDLAWGPQPAEVMKELFVLEGNVFFIRGNADREVALRYGVADGLDETTAKINQWCSEQLTKNERDFLINQKESLVLPVDGLGEVLFVHGSPRGDEEAIRRSTPDFEIIPMLEGVSQSMVVCGHTHVQFDRLVCGKRIINPGSVGLQSSARGACWALIDSEIELRETLYDFETTAREIRKSAVPYAEDFAEHVLNPPAEGP